MMTETEIQAAIIAAATDANLQKQESDEPIEAIARDVSSVLGYNSDMPSLVVNTINRALKRNGVKMTFLSVIDAIRKQYAEDQEEQKQTEVLKKAQEDNESANWNFFIKCWLSFKKHGDVKRINRLSIGFLAEWLINNPRMIDSTEVETCKEWMKRPDGISSFEETIVLYVMNKLKKTEESNPQKVDEFINRKKESVRIYYKEKYGSEPVWE